jgi:nicotinamide-nucleotide amidase
MNILNAANQLTSALAANQQRVVFAESCTGGLVAAMLAQVPGVSAVLCGSAVTYREATKEAWLGVSPDDLARYTAESEIIAEQMAIGVLQQTPEADLAASVTGHLGPDAPADVDGTVFVGIARRIEGQPVLDCVSRYTLAETERIARQHEAAKLVLERVLTAVSTPQSH